MKLFGSTTKLINKTKDRKKVSSLGVLKAVLLQ